MTASGDVPRYALAIVTPVLDEWRAWQRLLVDVDAELDGVPGEVFVLAVDDGSREAFVPGADFGGFSAITRIDVLELARNLGHQRAIAVGLAHVHAHIDCDAVVVMDADGDDDPRALARLREASARRPDAVIFAARGRRREGVLYRVAYAAYRWLFAALTGRRIRFGNYCLLPRALLPRIVYSPDIWNHVAAGILATRVPVDVVRADKGARYAGRSRMRLAELVAHGLSAAAVFSQILAVRLTMLSLALVAASLLGIVVVVGVRVLTDLAIPGWASNVVLMLAVICVQALFMSFLLTFIVLIYRTQRSFVPTLHAHDFVRAVRTVHVAP